MATTRLNRPIALLKRPFQSVTLSLALLAFLGATTAGAEATSDSAESTQGFRPSVNAQIVDAAILRPLDFTKMCVGSALLVVGAPFAVAGGLENLDVLTDVFVIQPYQNTFEKPLGMIE